MRLGIPNGATCVQIVRQPPHGTKFKPWDVGYVDGYVRDADDAPYAIVVRLDDGYMDLISITRLKGVSIDEI